MSNMYEYTNSYNNSYSSYANLEKYNKAANFGPKLPPTVPSSNFPTILQQHPIAGYDVLTHDTHSQYPDVSKAYGNSCKQKYFVRKCPTNKEIRPFNDHSILTPSPVKCPVENQEIVEGFSDLKSLDVLMFVDMSGKCKFSEKVMEMAKNHKFISDFKKVIDISKAKNEQIFTNHGGYATPFFFSLKTNKSVTGFVSKDKLVQMLSSHEGYHSPMHSKIHDMKLKVFVMEMCGFCQKLKKMLEDAGITENDVEYVKDLEHYSSELQNVRGFPHVKSMATGKEMTGCPSSVEKLIEHLS